MKKIGLYFGTFNPVHVGHLIIANYMVDNSDLDEVWMVVSPHSPLKKKKNLLEDHHRLAMVRIATDDNQKLKVSNIEFDLAKPSYTVFTLQVLKEKYPNHVFSLIMGEDNIRTLHKWKNFEYILENHEIYIYPRVQASQELDSIVKDDDNGFLNKDNVHICDAPLMNISSSFIRKAIKDNNDVRYILTEPVFKYLDEMNFYK